MADRLIDAASADQLNRLHQSAHLLGRTDQSAAASSACSIASSGEKTSIHAAFGRSLSISTITRHSIAAPSDQAAGGPPGASAEGHPPSSTWQGGTPPEAGRLNSEGKAHSRQDGFSPGEHRPALASAPKGPGSGATGEEGVLVRRGTGGRCRDCGGKGSGYLGITLCRRCRRERGIERDAQVRRLRTEGCSAPRIANQLGVPLGTVLRAIYRADRPLPLSTAERWQGYERRLAELWRGLGLEAGR